MTFGLKGYGFFASFLLELRKYFFFHLNSIYTAFVVDVALLCCQDVLLLLGCASVVGVFVTSSCCPDSYFSQIPVTSLPGRSTYVLFSAYLPRRISVKTSTNIRAENTLKCYSSLKVCILMGTLENLKALKTKRNQCLMVAFEAL